MIPCIDSELVLMLQAFLFGQLAASVQVPAHCIDALRHITKHMLALSMHQDHLQQHLLSWLVERGSPEL